MTDLQNLAAVAALTLFAAVVVAVGTGRSLAGRVGRGVAVCAVILVVLLLAWPG